jgi:predicted nuclease with TOPRIM domain
VEQNEMFQLILKEVRESSKEVVNELKQLNEKLDRIEKTVNSHTEILNSFKFDVDFLAEKQTKIEMKVNRLEKMMES